MSEQGGDRYTDVVDNLRRSYDSGVERRDQMHKTPWKLAEREAFAERLRADGCRRLLEIGAGTGQDSEYFAGLGLQVVAVDLSPAMVRRCRDKGIDAHAMDLRHLDLPPSSFDAVYSLNCLLHVPNADLPAVLRNIRAVLRPGGWFFLGVYGNEESSEGPATEWDDHDPPRFFSWRSNEQIQRFARESFDIVDFHTVPVRDGETFQSLTLRPK